MTLQGELDHKDQWKKLSQQELDEVLDKHEKFVNNQRDGERAQSGMHDLSYLDMEGADFRETDLRDADLSGSLLIDADFADADLRGTNLNDTDIRGTKGLPKKFEEDEAD